MLSQFQTIVNKNSGTQNQTGYASKNFTYAANAGNVIVGFDINSGCVIDGMSAIYTVPSSNLTATPVQSVLNPPFMGDSDAIGATGANGEIAILGGSQQTLMVPSGSFINGFNFVITNVTPYNVGYLQFSYINPATGATGTMSTKNASNPCGWNASSAVVTYTGSTANSALVGFSCFSSQYFGGFTQAVFYDYVADAAYKNSQKPTTTVASSDAGGTSVASVPSSTLDGIPMTYIYVLLVLLVVLGAVYYKKHNSVVVYTHVDKNSQNSQVSN